MARVLLIVPSETYRAADFLAAAARLGVEVVVASEHRQALSRSMGDRALVVGLRDPLRAAAAIVASARERPLDAIVGVDDRGVLTAALAAEALGLRGNPPAAVERTRDKAAMRSAFAGAGLSQPAYRVAGADADVGALARSVGLPCVVKPLTLSGSRGVIRADSGAAAAVAAERVRALVGAGAPLLVERFVAGPEVAVEGLLDGGRLTTLAVFDKPDPLDGPYFEETLYVTPSRLPAATLAQVEAAVGAAGSALGLREGPVHAELRLAPAPTLLEVAARSIGGLCARTLRFGLGVSLEELILRHALGLPLHQLERERPAAGVMMLPIPGAGTLRRVDGIERARSIDGVGGVEITIPAGRPVLPLPDGDRYLGFVFAKGETAGQVERILREAQDALDVDIAA